MIYGRAMSTPAGWYPDPELVNTRRYWDGEDWTTHRQEVSAPPSPAMPTSTPPPAQLDVSPRHDAISRWEIWGMFAAVFVAPLGLVIGGLLWAQGFVRGGRKIVITSVVVIVIVIILRLSGAMGTST